MWGTDEAGVTPTGALSWRGREDVMPDLILTEEQTQLLAGAVGPVVIRDAQGQVLGHVELKLTPARIAELKRRAAPGPRYTGAQVHARLAALQEEWDRVGGFDEAYMRQFLQRLDESDPPHFREPRSSP
jgi:hypothetical protein